MASLFVLSYSLALGPPTPHHVPAAVVGSTRAEPRLVSALERETQGGLHLSPVTSVRAAEAAIEQQRVYAALVLNRSPPKLLLASASGRRARPSRRSETPSTSRLRSVSSPCSWKPVGSPPRCSRS